MADQNKPVVVLGVTGGIAAYKACEVVSRLKKAGTEVHVIMTENACKLVAPLTFQTLSGNPVVVDTFAPPVTYEVEHIAFAPDYVEEVRKHDIQITPIAIGTGTKGKVLDAIANGLLVIGTEYALENIAVEDGASCLQYDTKEELLAILADIPRNRERYEEMAERGRQTVLREHNRESVAAQVFGLI